MMKSHADVFHQSHQHQETLSSILVSSISKRSEVLFSTDVVSSKFFSSPSDDRRPTSVGNDHQSNFLSIVRMMVLIVIVNASLFRGASAVTVHEVRLLSDSGKTDYVLVGEGVIFSCLFMLDADEVIQSVVWEKDKEQVYYYKVSGEEAPQEPPVAVGILKGHVDLQIASPSSLSIKNATTEMQGSYSCHVITQKSKSQNEAFLIVILDACKENSWETHSDMVSCIEDITFYCRGMFPKPSPVCGIYNDQTGSYVQSVPFDRVDRMEDGTFEISLFRRLHAKDWLGYPGQLSFRCFIIVMSTTWRRGIHHRLFGDAGCISPPPNVAHGYYNMTSENTCWKTARDGSRLSYGCQPGYQLLGPESLICRNGTWHVVPPVHRIDPTTLRNSSAKVFNRRLIPKGPQITVCNSSLQQNTSGRWPSVTTLMLIIVVHVVFSVQLLSDETPVGTLS